MVDILSIIVQFSGPKFEQVHTVVTQIARTAITVLINGVLLNKCVLVHM
jgi:hypothetical protein